LREIDVGEAVLTYGFLGLNHLELDIAHYLRVLVGIAHPTTESYVFFEKSNWIPILGKLYSKSGVITSKSLFAITKDTKISYLKYQA
jgi:hypothetical protein